MLYIPGDETKVIKCQKRLKVCPRTISRPSLLAIHTKHAPRIRGARRLYSGIISQVRGAIQHQLTGAIIPLSIAFKMASSYRQLAISQILFLKKKLYINIYIYT